MVVMSQSDVIRGAVTRALSDVKNDLASINRKLDMINPSKEENIVNNDVITLHWKGKMVWWTKVKDASCYRLRLFIREDEIDVIEIERNKAYYSFCDLNFNLLPYKVVLEVEDRNGNIISELSMSI